MSSSPISYPRTAFMIVAHDNPALLARLASRLQADWTRVVVLIDAKADIAAFTQALQDTPVFFVDPDLRIDVQWGGIGLTTAAIRMMRTAINEFQPDRLCMLSGVDYPIKPIGAIGEAFRSDTEFLRIDRVVDPRGAGEHDRFVRYAYYNDVRMLNPRSSPLPRLQRAAARLLRILPRKAPADTAFYHGSGWWCITRGAADWVLNVVDDRPDLLDFFRYVNCPDEIFLQTVLKDSPFAPRISQDLTLAAEGHARNVHGCHYVDWPDRAASSPKPLDIGDLPALRGSPALFARKIDPVRSLTLLDALDDLDEPARRPVPMQ